MAALPELLLHQVGRPAERALLAVVRIDDGFGEKARPCPQQQAVLVGLAGVVLRPPAIEQSFTPNWG